MADIFVSYTSSDKDWAFWIGQELEKLGHTAHVHKWEISAGGDIAAWMEERHDKADHILCVVSEAYLRAPYSSWERQAAQWAAVSTRPRFALPVFVEDCEAPTLLAPFKRCDLHGIGEQEARARLAEYLTPAAKPTGPARFPGSVKSPQAPLSPPEPVTFPGGSSTSQGAPTASLRVPNLPAAQDLTPELEHVAESKSVAAESWISSSKSKTQESAIPDQAGRGRAAHDGTSRTGLLIAGAAGVALIIAAGVGILQSRRPSEIPATLASPTPTTPASAPMQTQPPTTTDSANGSSNTGVTVRAIINVTPDFLMSLYSDKTRVQGDAAASLYVGKWLEFRGIVENVSQSSSGDVVLASLVSRLHLAILWIDDRDKNVASTYSIGQKIDAVCQLKKVDEFSLVLEKCEFAGAMKE